MEAQEIRYRVNKKVFRQASLYAMFLRNRNTFRVGIAVVLAVAFYTVLAVQGTFPLSYLPIYIAAAYLVWMLLLLGRVERRFRARFPRRSSATQSRSRSSPRPSKFRACSCSAFRPISSTLCRPRP